MGDLLEVKDIYKSFGDVEVLKGIRFSVKTGEIHALVGENGAGKSTIIKIICGVYSKDSGDVLLNGVNTNFNTPKDAIDAGIRVIHQELNMVHTLTVAENIFLGCYPRTKQGLVDWKKMNEEAEKVLSILGEEIDVTQKVANISIAEQQMIEIAKAVSVRPKILIMDEPTAALNDQETENLFLLLEKLKRQGVSIIYITHRFSELYRLADTVTVLRDGKSIAVFNKGELNDDLLISMMAGEGKTTKYEKRNLPIGDKILDVKSVSVDGILSDVNMTIRKGEIVVIFGLVGCGETELCEALFGARPLSSGDIYLNGQKLEIKDIDSAIKQGIGYVSADRKKEGIIPLLSVQENIDLPAYRSKLANRLGIINFGHAKKLAKIYYERLHIKGAGLKQQIGSLSGGNQQKGMIGRWLANDVKLLILNMPTRGVDVGARAEIYRSLENLAEQGVAILAVSPEMPEALAIADTIYVMHDGKITGKVEHKDATQETLMRLALGIGKEA